MKLSVFITLVAIGTARMNSWAYTANDGAKTVLTDGSESDTTSGFLYAQAKAQDGWVITIGTAGQAYTWTTAFGYTIANRMTIIRPRREPGPRSSRAAPESVLRVREFPAWSLAFSPR